jgi:cytochrome c-type biogenesis protein CcmH/NrfG
MIPWEGPRLRVVVLGAVLAAAAFAGVWTGRTSERADAAQRQPSTSSVRVDVTTEELEAVVTDNPSVVPMRLAFVERLLTDGEVVDAHAHARVALDQATTIDDRQRALTLTGWASALIGAPAQGAELLDAALVLEPTDRDAKWYLANVRLIGLDDPVGAVPLLEDLLATVREGPRRVAVEARLAEARARIAARP